MLRPLPEYKGSRLDSIGLQLMRGNKAALFQLAPYLDSTQLLSEHLGYHLLQTSEHEIAQRLIEENSSFLPSELILNDSLTSAEFLFFLGRKKGSILFDTLAETFLITPFAQRSVRYELRSLSAVRKAELDKILLHYPIRQWMDHDQIEQLIRDDNPLLLFRIAAALYKGRMRFDSYQDDKGEYMALLENLTGTEYGVEDEQHRVIFHIEKAYSNVALRNLLIYFAGHYQAYKWNPSAHVFTNREMKLAPAGKEMVYFQLLKSKADSVALHAYIALTTCNPETVAKLADEYDRVETFAETNYILPTFPYRFLKVLTQLTAYCNSNHINFRGSAQLRQVIETLKQEQPFAKRRRTEDALARSMTPDEVTALEYWCAVYEKKVSLTYSTGRILNIYYSRHWKQIISDPRQLSLYLKKAVWYDRLGIIGVCNNYFDKFINADAATLAALKNFAHLGTDTVAQAKAWAMARRKPGVVPSKKFNDANYDAKVTDLKKEFLLAVEAGKDSDDRDSRISLLFSKISYAQVDTALKLVEPYRFKNHWKKYSFAERDFGFFMTDFENEKDRAAFSVVYETHTEAQLYAYYLKQAGINYLNQNRTLDYDKIYELLKYDEVNAFAGGGGGTQDNEVYALVKLLELKFDTTLGYPVKLCNSDSTYGCTALNRASEWMQYLKNRKLLKLNHASPVSFQYE